MWQPLSNFPRACDWSPAEGGSQSARWEGPQSQPARAPAGIQVGGWRGAASGQAGRAGTRSAAGQPRSRASMRGDHAARRLALQQLALPLPLPPPPLLLLLLLLSRAGALHPDELFPYGQSRGDQLLQEGDDESSAPVKLASPLRFYEAQFSYLYVSSAPAWCGNRQLSRSFFPPVNVVWISPNPCLPSGGNSPHAGLSPSAPGVGPGSAAVLLSGLLFFTSRGRARIQTHKFVAT